MKTDRIAFFKVENDGLDLGAQRRPIDKNDLPQVRTEITEYLRRLRAGESVDDFEPILGLITEKEKIAENGEYNARRAISREDREHSFSLVSKPIQFELFCVESGGTPSPVYRNIGMGVCRGLHTRFANRSGPLGD